VTATLVAVTVLMLVVPLPTWLLDGLIGINLGLSVALLAAALLQRRALELSALPTALVLLTVFRLALNVSSVRLILLQANAGRIIHAFGSFVVRGDALTGIALFALLALVQLLVIARGGERVAEVAARFALDALPSRLAAIDAELRLGAFGADGANEARRRRAALMREAQLYGSLDGAMRFVRGDAIASIAVLAVSLVGGLAVGILRRGLPASEAARLYTLLTVGDGLVTQVPSLIVATAASLVVTRAGANDEGEDASVGGALLAELGRPRALIAAAVILGLLAVVPGLPFVPFSLTAALFGLAAWATRKGPALRPEVVYPPRTPEIEIAVDTTLLAIDARLTADADRATLRVAEELGLPIASPVVRLDARLPHRGYRILVRGTVMAEGVVPADRVFVDCPPARLPEGVEGEAADEPLTGQLASFVPSNAADAVRRAGLTTRDADEVVGLRLEAVLRGAAPELLGLEETQRLLDRLREHDAALVRDVIPAKLSLAALTQVLRRLVGEAVSIGDLRLILEQLTREVATEGEDPIMLGERIRLGLRRQLSARYASGRRIEALILDGDAEEAVRGAVRPTASGALLQIEPDLADALLDSVRSELGSQPHAVLLTPRELRRHVRRLVEGEFPRLPVLAFDELQPDVLVERVGTLRVS
jgi:type III secretion protein V